MTNSLKAAAASAIKEFQSRAYGSSEEPADADDMVELFSGLRQICEENGMDFSAIVKSAKIY